MDMQTLSFVIAVNGIALVLLVAFMALFRRDRGLSIYALSFSSAVAGGLLLMYYAGGKNLLLVLISNHMLLFYHLGMSWGLRTSLGFERPWPHRFWAYQIAWSAILAVSILVPVRFFLPPLFASVFIIIATTEFILCLRRLPQTLPASIRRFGTAVALSFILFHIVRVILIINNTSPTPQLMDNNILNTYTLMFSAFHMVLWAGVILIIDNAMILAQLKGQNRLLQDLATTDALTGLLNRHMLDEKLAVEIKRSGRYGIPLSLVMFDLDHFKQINDTRGHQVGDEVLKCVASICKSQCREPDNLFRWGGEEFLLMAPHTDLSGAVIIAEKIRQAIASHQFQWDGSVTASFGVAQWRPQDGCNDLFLQVDHALYRAKNTGRNRVVSFGLNDHLPVAAIKIEWQDSWSSGNALIDKQHRVLFDMSNNLLDLSLSQADALEMNSRLDELFTHIKGHFADEERILAQAGYPELELHAQLHSQLMEEYQYLKALMDRGDCPPAALFDFLVGKVVIEHIMKSDVLFFPYTR
ncbi:putative protein [Geobacter sp. OR-1]|uniref:diguanylate cyclase n=1 Tax=Geobacter sp. OR-1 TaxID=1266765 RepID=UPI00054415E5|nr:diguanylate cyclase [Geobacter sp. OR-1]GAM07893.1 putative protein [Geobacter sp. OR-1]